jgi:hypothetical protein
VHFGITPYCIDGCNATLKCLRCWFVFIARQNDRDRVVKALNNTMRGAWGLPSKMEIRHMTYTVLVRRTCNRPPKYRFIMKGKQIRTHGIFTINWVVSLRLRKTAFFLIILKYYVAMQGLPVCSLEYFIFFSIQYIYIDR